MKTLKKLLTVVIAAALVLALAPSQTAKAGMKNEVKGGYWAWSDYGFYCINTKDVLPDNFADVWGIEIIMEMPDVSGGMNGGIIINGEIRGWESTKWGTEDQMALDAQICVEATGNGNDYRLRFMADTAPFQPTEGYANFAFQHWWDTSKDITFKSVKLLDKTGKVLYDSEKAVSGTDATPKTGDVVIYAGIALAALCGAAFVTMKLAEKKEI